MENYGLFLALGGLLLIGLIADQIGRRVHVPRVTLLILFGFAGGPSGFDVLPDAFREWYDVLATAALTMVAFLLGGKLSLATLRDNGKAIVIVSLSVVGVTVVVVGAGLLMIGSSSHNGIAVSGHRNSDGARRHPGCRETSRSAGAFHGHVARRRGN